MYPGNKKIGSEPILEILNNHKFDGYKYLEPFVGMGHILRRVEKKSCYIASDLNPYAYHILKALQRHACFPDVTKCVYQLFKANHREMVKFDELMYYLPAVLQSNDSVFSFEELDSFAALATFRSQPWSTYQGDKENGESQDFKSQREKEYVLLVNSETFFQADIFLRDYQEYSPDITHTVIYMDPPYIHSSDRNEKHYGKHVKGFDYDAFWNRVRMWSRPELDNAVFVSEYTAPKDFIAIKEFKKKGAYHTNTEKLFMTKQSHVFWFQSR